MIETLFAQQAQGRAFLAMLLGGLVVAAVGHGASVLRRWRRWLAVPGDVLMALALLAALLYPMILLETPLRLYSLLGLALGGALYAAGIGPAAERFLRWMKKCVRSQPQKKGKPAPDAKT